MLKDRAGAPRLRGNTLHLVPALAGIPSVIDATASRGDHMIGITRIDIDGEDVGIVDDTVLNYSPGAATVRGFIGKVPGPCVDRIRVAGIDCQRLDMD